MGLSFGELVIYNRALTRSHQRRILVEVLTLGGRLVTAMRAYEVLEGQWVYDDTVEDGPPASLELRLLDPTRTLQVDAATPGGVPLHQRYMLRVWDSRFIDELGRWVDCPIFTGPLWDCDRTGPELSLVAQSLERQAMGNKWTPKTYQPKKDVRTAAIKDMLRSAGETALDGIPDLPNKVSERITLTRMSTVWPPIKKLVKSLDRHIFYEGLGRPIMRTRPGASVFTFDERHLLDDIEIGRDPEGNYNTWVVLGKKPKGKAVRPEAVDFLPAWHPSSKESRARVPGSPLYIVNQVENRQVGSKAEAVAYAASLRKEAMTSTSTIGFSTIPVPHLEPQDLVTVVSPDGTFRVRMRQWTLPLGIEGAPPMTVGSIWNAVAVA